MDIMTGLVAPEVARSWLLVPGRSPDLFDAAVDSPADAVVLDLEDAVPAAAKPAAREGTEAWLREGGKAWVRVNDATTSFWADDLAALAGLPGLQGVMLAKAESGHQVEATADLLPEGTRILVLIESAMGLEAAPEIARAEGTFRLVFGSGDFRRDTGMSDSPMAMAYARSRLVITSRAARLPGPIDGPTLSDDPEVLEREAELTRSMGMTGKLCMTGERASYANVALSPNSTDVDWAEGIIDKLGEDGRNVRDGSDLPNLAKAKKISELARMFGIGRSR
ncbi:MULTISPECIES: HpcH/HpaI aldolase/citrate lyase family protein [Rhodococcus]|uniref:HpcH/HpaI aldolase/citrate lyase family protein n=1 Tax=Rhodococcus TaxID=1827 RepID=UPI00132F239B|nr:MULTISPECIES: CoA ester lyase [Rhodococcus]QHG84038.1 CoA ester lyase [Rhodococcus rhodochrous]QOH56283.1 CoA ester lyase [Rhodococcus rhodochrous]WAL48287.1 CoA ester lyase [Rhodococcus pyridinivorans]